MIGFNWLQRILFLRRHIKRNNIVFQVGFSLDRLYSDVFPISWIVGRKGRLIIVEPDPRSYFKLMKRKWMMKDNWTFLNYIVSIVNWEYITLMPKSKHNSTLAGDYLLKVDQIRLDDFYDCDVIILTCNGSELDCLLSGKNLLNKGVKFIIANANLEIEKLLLSYKYRLTFEKVGRQKLLVAER